MKHPHALQNIRIDVSPPLSALILSRAGVGEVSQSYNVVACPLRYQPPTMSVSITFVSAEIRVSEASTHSRPHRPIPSYSMFS